MTVDELLARECIRHTIAAYHMAADRLLADDLAALFTEDAILESKGAKSGTGFRYEGRETIRAWMAGWRQPQNDAPARRSPRFVRHNLSTSLIDLTGPEEARGQSYFVTYTDIGPDHCGRYLDVFRKTGDRWLFAHRVVRTEWWSADSFFLPAQG